MNQPRGPRAPDTMSFTIIGEAAPVVIAAFASYGRELTVVTPPPATGTRFRASFGRDTLFAILDDLKVEVIDIEGVTRADCERYWRLPDEVFAAMPLVSKHESPQVAPQEYECGCVTIEHITGDRDRGFEMRLAVLCESPTCELAELRARDAAAR